MKTVPKRLFSHQITLFLKEKKDLKIVGRAFTAYLTFKNTDGTNRPSPAEAPSGTKEND